jgi:hypothetical protein
VNKMLMEKRVGGRNEISLGCCKAEASETDFSEASEAVSSICQECWVPSGTSSVLMTCGELGQR